ncbi:hypothetical protein BGY98DRAFT_1174812 [Russula aff. rugulosa BPL654]|nr:hypothetical protein BGY98DRAFT_1174812 [Russula aff. rugulosa BPL654]
MSNPATIHRSPSISLSSFHLSFREAILTYNKRTKNDLLFHPLAPLFQSCNDPALALSLLQRHAQASPQSWISDEKLKTLLVPTLFGLYAISSGGSSGDAGVGLVLSPEKAILVAIGILLSVRIFPDSLYEANVTPDFFQEAQAVSASQARVVEILTHMRQSFDLLPTDTPVTAREEIMLQVFSILTSATVGVKQGKTEKMFKQMAGKNEVDKALQKLLESMQDMSAQRESQNPSADLNPLRNSLALVGEPRTLF